MVTVGTNGEWVPMANEDAQLKIRIPAQLNERLLERAAENGRSLNSEIAMILAERLRDDAAFDLEALKNPEGAEEIAKEMDASVAISRKTGVPVNIIFTNRVIERLTRLEETVDKKLAQLNQTGAATRKVRKS
jgi:hypothetical protein